MKLADLDSNQQYSYADYYRWDFENRVELINGKVFEMLAAPSTWHQMLAGKLFLKLGNFLNSNSECKVFIAPFDVRLPRKTKEDKDIFTVLQPDLCVISDAGKIDRKGCIGAPDIVVEILSPGNNTKELKNKFSVYEESGVKEYWVVSPQDNTFLINLLVDGKYITTRPMVAGDIVTSLLLPGFSIDLEQLFEGINYE
jgi:Uma2 family endonuclease